MKSFWRNPFFWLFACFFASFVLLVYPIYVIRPFRQQGPTELSVALQVMRARPALSVALSVSAVLLVFRAWRQVRRPVPRVGIAFLAACTVICSGFSFINVYELMFHPLHRPTFRDVSRTHLGDAEQVIAVRLAGAARAYPIRIISYHHIVNDVLAGLPIVTTY